MNYIIKGGELHQKAVKEIANQFGGMGVPSANALQLAKEIPTAIMECADDGSLILTGSLTQTMKLMAKSYKLGNLAEAPFPHDFKNEFELCGGDLERQRDCTVAINDLINKIELTPRGIATFGSEMDDTLNSFMDVGAGDSEPRNHILDKVEKLFKKSLDNMQGLF